MRDGEGENRELDADRPAEEQQCVDRLRIAAGQQAADEAAADHEPGQRSQPRDHAPTALVAFAGQHGRRLCASSCEPLPKDDSTICCEIGEGNEDIAIVALQQRLEVDRIAHGPASGFGRPIHVATAVQSRFPRFLSGSAAYRSRSGPSTGGVDLESD